ncbi:hypothetical protein KQ51_01710 [Candidatus Izimaplasma bacterium HR1]|jgi:hypothetical protein|uniref:hypothetical protein n=1 Tax=Candidatus Izimoplasma sp. HR1 TaxID=1541959 RepID=UPI0004F7495E|nr:hypothetical protein KQ51_01710 [Candidatus Izimaplasma bacterium HR1]
MSNLTKIISWILLVFGATLTVVFVIQVYDMLIKDSRFLFFQIIFAFVWGVGALIFWIIGLALLRSGKRKENENDES